MKTKALQIRNAIFWALVVFFAALVASLSLVNRWRFWGHKHWGLAIIGITFCGLAAALVVLTAKLKESGVRKFFFILTVASAIGIPVCAILHNLVFALCIKYNCIYWSGSDEPVFFILALLVCPALFILGILGSIVLLISARLKKKNLSGLI
jgi:hypothetical protein